MKIPQWLQECPLKPVPPIDMKTVYIGKGLKLIQLDDICGPYVQARSVYVEVDEYFEIE